jgi:hypothetical protein
MPYKVESIFPHRTRPRAGFIDRFRYSRAIPQNLTFSNRSQHSVFQQNPSVEQALPANFVTPSKGVKSYQPSGCDAPAFRVATLG